MPLGQSAFRANSHCVPRAELTVLVAMRWLGSCGAGRRRARCRHRTNSTVLMIASMRAAAAARPPPTVTPRLLEGNSPIEPLATRVLSPFKERSRWRCLNRVQGQGAPLVPVCPSVPGRASPLPGTRLGSATWRRRLPRRSPTGQECLWCAFDVGAAWRDGDRGRQGPFVQRWGGGTSCQVPSARGRRCGEAIEIIRSEPCRTYCGRVATASRWTEASGR